MKQRRTTEQRFWSKVDCSDPKGCWEWMATKHMGGYGHFRYKDRMAGAHRVAWELSNGPVPDGLFVLHRCDNPACVNPAHLWVDTPAANTRDMVEKGRYRQPELRARGERHGRAKLTELQVIGIMARWLQGETQHQVAREYKVRYELVHKIVHGQIWAHVFAVHGGKE